MIIDLDKAFFKVLFGVIGNIIGVGVNLAPVGTFYNIYLKKSTQGFSALPYVFGLSAALLWLVYGNPLITPASTLLLTINAAASFIQICYLAIFFTYGAKNRRRHAAKVLSLCMLALAIVAIVAFAIAGKHQETARRMVGLLCVVIGIMSYASPLSVARIVIITRSVEFLPIVLICFLFVNSVIWTLYGIFSDDIFVMIPNGFGVVFGVAQLSLYLIYRNCTPVDPLDPANWKLPPDEKTNNKTRRSKKNPIIEEKSQRGTKKTGGTATGKVANEDGKVGEKGAAANGDVKHEENGHFPNADHVVHVPSKEQQAANGDDEHRPSLSTVPDLARTPKHEYWNPNMSIASPLTDSYSVNIKNTETAGN